MTVLDILKMIIEALFPREYMVYIGGTFVFIFIVGPCLGLDNKKNSQKS
ncbi:MAG: hypothetical protein QG583_583 [Patescibacteria group bacterium]|nr:hypothetical protein [Patescibacteria group bacterium]